jgi:hypothetical protein
MKIQLDFISIFLLAIAKYIVFQKKKEDFK